MDERLGRWWGWRATHHKPALRTVRVRASLCTSTCVRVSGGAHHTALHLGLSFLCTFQAWESSLPRTDSSVKARAEWAVGEPGPARHRRLLLSRPPGLSLGNAGCPALLTPQSRAAPLKVIFIDLEHFASINLI